jgi:hypothetical protein
MIGCHDFGVNVHILFSFFTADPNYVNGRAFTVWDFFVEHHSFAVTFKIILSLTMLCFLLLEFFHQHMSLPFIFCIALLYFNLGNWLHGAFPVKLMDTSLAKKFPLFNGTQSMIVKLRSTHHVYLSSARWIRVMPSHAFSLGQSNIIHLPFGLFQCNFLTRAVCVLWHACHIWVSELTVNFNIKHLESHNPYSWESDVTWTYKQNLFQLLLLYPSLIWYMGISQKGRFPILLLWN